METLGNNMKSHKELSRKVFEIPRLIREEVGKVELEMERKLNSTTIRKFGNFERKGHRPVLKHIGLIVMLFPKTTKYRKNVTMGVL